MVMFLLNKSIVKNLSSLLFFVETDLNYMLFYYHIQYFSCKGQIITLYLYRPSSIVVVIPRSIYLLWRPIV